MSPERERMTVRKEEARTTSGKARARLGKVVQRTGAFCAKIDLLLLVLQDDAKGTGKADGQKGQAGHALQDNAKGTGKADEAKGYAGHPKGDGKAWQGSAAHWGILCED